MSDAVFHGCSAFFELLAGCLNAACMAVLFRPFLRSGSRAGAVFAVYMLVWFIDRAWGLPQSGAILPAVLLLLLLSGRLGVERADTFFLAAVFYCSKMSAALVIGSLHYIAADRLFGPLTDMETVYLRSLLSTASIELLHSAALAVMTYAIRRQLLKRPLELQPKVLCYLSLFPVSGILFGGMIAGILFEIQDGVFLELYRRHPAFLALVPLLAALFYAGTYLAIALQQETTELQEEKETWFAERQQVRAIRERMDEADRFYSQLQELRHDLRSHLTNIKGLAQGGSYEELDAYIARMDESIGGFELSAHTGNAVTDVIISDKRKEAARLGIEFRADFRYPASGQYNAYEIGIILHNLLQNALEACAGESGEGRYISLTGRQKKKFLLIEVRNSFSGGVSLDSRTGLPVTSKRGGFHGLGLSNVRREVEKYMGDMEVKADNNEFCVTILLQEVMKI